MSTREDESNAEDMNDDFESSQVFDASSIQSRRSSVNSTTTTTTTTALQPPIRQKRWFLLELPVFLLFFTFYLTGAVYQNQLLYQTCVYIYQYNETSCSPLLSVERESSETQIIEQEVQKYVAYILLTRSLIESIIPAFVSLFIGPWSDKFGRRPILLNTFFGYPTGAAIFAIIAFISTKVVISPWWFLLSSIPSILTGGTCALITGAYCYISDVVKGRGMSMRMIFNEASLCLGMMFGSISSSYVYEATNVYIIFAIAAALSFMAWLYVFFVVEESLRPEQIQRGPRLREFFKVELVKDLVQTCIKRRPNYDRAIIWSTIVGLTLIIFAMEGEGNLVYLFVRERFVWSLKDYTFFNAYRIIVQILGSLFGTLVLRKYMNVSIVSMTLLAYGSCVLETVTRATAVYWWELYLGMFLGMMRGIVGPMSRAILTHLTPPTECGKIMAFTTSLESLSPLIAAPLYTSVYRETLLYYPGAFYFISTTVDFICFTLMTYVFYIQKMYSNTQTYKAIGS